MHNAMAVQKRQLRMQQRLQQEAQARAVRYRKDLPARQDQARRDVSSAGQQQSAQNQ